MWFMKNTVTQVYDPTGELHYLLQAKRITAYEENEIQFFKPILQLKEGAVPWILSATNGTAFQGKQGTITHFELRNDVLLKREQPQAQLTTSELTYYPASQTVHTEAAVAYQEPHLRITGKGAHVELTKHRVLLNHNVETHYEGLSP